MMRLPTIAVVDIGASGGAHPRWQALGGRCRRVLVEPDPDACEELRASARDGDVILEKALADRAGPLSFHICKKQETSSIYRPDLERLGRYPEVDRFEIAETIRLQADTLDQQLAEQGVERVDFIKVDTQGSELPILRGAASTLSQVVGIEVEAEFAALYQGQPVFRDLDAYLCGQGFELIDLRRHYSFRSEVRPNTKQKKGQIFFADALYFRAPEALIEHDRFDTHTAFAALEVYLAYGYVDLAEVLLARLREHRTLEDEAVDALASRLAELAPGGHQLPNFRGRGRLWQAIAAFSAWLEPFRFYRGSDRAIGSG